MTRPGPADSETSGPPEPEPIPATRSEPDSAPAAPPEPPAVKPGQIPAAGRPPARAADPRASFHLPNARVGVPYAAPIEGRDSEGRPVRILDVRIPEGLGLDFDPESAELRGTPRTDGDHRLRVLWTPSRGASYSGDCLLIVNPDPRSLWKILEPPADAPYPKPHTEALWIPGETGQLLGASRRGRSHEHAASFRDDDFFIRQDTDSGWNLLMVADGAGSARFSREGSRLAVRSAGEHLAASLAGDLGARMTAALNQWDSDPEATGQTMGREFHFLFHEAGTRALRAIEQEAQTRDTPVRDYATTLLTAAIRRRGRATFLATFWMGDGAIAAYGPRGRVRLMGSPDGGEFAGQTRFLDRAALSDQGFAKRIGIGYFEDLSAVMLMTDGVSDPRFETDNGLNDPARWDRLWDELTPILESPEPDRGLLDWMDFFSPGNHDDRTIALLW